VLAVALGLGASIAWGFADFLGGLKARQLALLTVMLGSQAAGLVLIAAIVAIRGEGAPGGDFALFAALSGAAGVVGLASFYRGLAVGAMAVVAPISSLAAAIPVAVGIATGDRPSALQLAGVLVALVGVAFASREEVEEARRGETRIAAGVGFALLSAVGFGCFFVAMDAASDDDVFWAVLVNRITSVTLLVAAVAIARPRLSASGGDLRMLGLIGVLDISANALFAVASTEGLVSIVSVLASLYPVTVVVLAYVVLRERIQQLQLAGAAGALAGVALITAG
jgi:drug/metabolite transporter (DMT)-like permease